MMNEMSKLCSLKAHLQVRQHEDVSTVLAMAMQMEQIK